MRTKIEEKIQFVKKHKVEIALIGGLVVGVAVGALVMRTHVKTIVKEVVPEWAANWEKFCFDNNRLMESGLPIFADDAQMTIFRDAFAPEANIQDFIDAGFTVIERG